MFRNASWRRRAKAPAPSRTALPMERNNRLSGHAMQLGGRLPRAGPWAPALRSHLAQARRRGSRPLMTFGKPMDYLSKTGVMRAISAQPSRGHQRDRQQVMPSGGFLAGIARRSSAFGLVSGHGKPWMHQGRSRLCRLKSCLRRCSRIPHHLQQIVERREGRDRSRSILCPACASCASPLSSSV